MFSIFTYIMSRVTHSEPGLPMVETKKEDQVNLLGVNLDSKLMFS